MFVKHFNATLQKFWYFYYAYRRGLLCKARHSSAHARVFCNPERFLRIEGSKF